MDLFAKLVQKLVLRAKLNIWISDITGRFYFSVLFVKSGRAVNPSVSISVSETSFCSRGLTLSVLDEQDPFTSDNGKEYS